MIVGSSCLGQWEAACSLWQTTKQKERGAGALLNVSLPHGFYLFVCFQSRALAHGMVPTFRMALPLLTLFGSLKVLSLYQPTHALLECGYGEGIYRS